jgi:fermentation-respiration switch protein FrsA (DUF1100 family)
LLPDFARRHPQAIRFSILALVLVVLIALILSHLERFFLFFPTSEIVTTPAELGVHYEDVYFTTNDGLRLNGWFVPGTSEITWLWFHGNGGNISHRTEEIVQIRHLLGVNLFIIDYRGYGKSQGTPSEQGTYQDARAALDYLRSRPDISPDQIVYFGRSLGAAVAVKLAVEHPPRGMILVAPFASLKDMARIHYPALPGVAWLARNRYNSLARISAIESPLLILHGDQDIIVPLSQGRKLFEEAGQPKQFQILPGAGHDDSYLTSGDAYWGTISSFLETLDE